MSVYICEKSHIVYILQAARALQVSVYFPNRHRNLQTTSNGEIAEFATMLHLENCESYAIRYCEATPTEQEFQADEFHHTIRATVPQLLKAIHCYQYQACASHDWATSDALKLTQEIERDIIRKIDGYAEAKWGAPAK